MDAAEIKALIARAKREDISFAFGRGKDKGEVFLLFDKRKKPDALFRALRAENKVTKGAWGTLSIDGVLAQFAPEKPLSGMARDLRILFKRDRIPVKVAVLGDEEEEEDERGSEATGGADASTEEAAGDASRSDPRPDTSRLLAKRLGKMLPAIKQAVRLMPAQADSLKEAYRDCQKALGTGDEAAGAVFLNKLEQAVSAERLSTMGKLRADMDALLPALKAAASDPDRAGAIRELWKSTDQAIGEGQAAAADLGLAQLRRLASDSEVSHDEGPLADRLATRWRQAFIDVQKGLSVYEQALVAKYSPYPNHAEDLAGARRQLADKLSQLRVDLTKELPRALQPGGEREAAAVRSRAAALRGFLDSDKFLKAFDGNLLTPSVKVIGPMVAVLDDILSAVQGH